MQKNPVVFLVDDDPSILRALSRALRRHCFEVEVFESAAAFLLAFEDKPGCLVLDLSMPEMTGLELQQELIESKITLPIIFITGHGGVPESVQALRAGAIDFLEKPFLPEVLMQRIEEAFAQDEKTRKHDQQIETIRKRISALTGREQDVFKLLIEEQRIPSSKEMARSLDISHRTVEHHRARIFEKTRINSVVELRMLAQKVGLFVSEFE